MKTDKHLSIRLTDERNRQIDRLRQLLQSSGRKVETIHGVVTTSAIIDAAFKALEAQLGGNDQVWFHPEAWQAGEQEIDSASDEGLPSGIPGNILQQRARAAGFSAEDLTSIGKVIEEDCEKVEASGW